MTKLHPVTWVVWTVVVAAAAVLTHNPFYLVLLLGIAVINYTALSRGQPEASSWSGLLRLAFGFMLLTIPLNALGVHGGAHILFRLPANWPLVGGPITLEAVIWGVCSALSLMTLIQLFAAFSFAVSRAQLLGLTPTFIYEAGLIVSIALTFFPQMIASAQEIREAQRIRGYPMRRLRDMRPFVIALLTTSLERSMQLAEAMEARGFGAAPTLPHRTKFRMGRELIGSVLTLIGLGGALSGFFLVTYNRALPVFGWVVLAVSVVLLLGTFWMQGKRVQRSRYRRERWTWRDGVVLLVSAAAACGLILARMQAENLLAYYPYTTLQPMFTPWVGVLLVALVVPTVLI